MSKLKSLKDVQGQAPAQNPVVPEKENENASTAVENVTPPAEVPTETPKEVEQTPAENAAPAPVIPKMRSLKDLKNAQASTAAPAAQGETPAKKVSESLKNSTFTEEAYIKILSDGKAHKIQDLLKIFNLPNSSSGREKFRTVNRKIVDTGKFQIEKVNEGGACFKLVNLNGAVITDALPAPSPAKETPVVEAAASTEQPA